MPQSLILTSVAAITLAASAAGAQSQPLAADSNAALAEPPLCTDRPTKSGNTCTVPAGDVQIEADVINWSRASADGVTSKTILFTNPTLKYGVLSNLDVEMNWAPLIRVRTTVEDRPSRANTFMSTGDLFLRVKWAAVSGDAFSFSVIPYVKVPTASDDVGNGHVEGGMIGRMKFSLPANFSLIVAPELDAFENVDRTGSHLNVINVINLNRSFGRWTVFGEIWNQQSFDPAETFVQTTADTAVAYLVTKTLQLDVGANFGLTRAAPQQQYYIGVSKRF
jgi:Putative MetA-pathway of phenol degradation